MPETEPPVVNKENANRKPFVIRGHHLMYFAWLVNKSLKGSLYESQSLPPILAKLIRRSAKSATEEYEEDTFGVTLEQADKSEKHLVQTFGEFLRLPDNHPVEIVEEMLDIICSGCAVGKHCRNRSIMTSNGKGRDTRDIDAFFRRLNYIKSRSGLAGKDQLPKPVIQEQTLCFDTEPLSVRRISTTLGVVKRVLNLNEASKAVGNDIFLLL